MMGGKPYDIPLISRKYGLITENIRDIMGKSGENLSLPKRRICIFEKIL